jgi:hypothetical protein
MTRLHLSLLLVLLGHATACDDGFKPSLSNFAFDGQARDSPTVLLLSTDFHDGDGDLGQGTLETFIDSRPTNAGNLALPTLFAQSGLDLSATDGDLQFVLEVNLGESSPASGSTFKLGVRATDAAGNSSPTSEITLQLTY